MKSALFGSKEAMFLAPYAVKSRDSKGRRFKEKTDNARLCFQKDKERIIHSKAFRRLDKKTQVFISGSGDHFRSRLTHTLEVAQISRDISRRLGLNEDLAEAIALAHDLGHPPFGHAGEKVLDEIMRRHGMHFEHNEQSKRIVEKLEKSYPDFDGLNLTKEVLEGLIKHQTAWDQNGKVFEVSPHLEAQIVNIADEIAYTNHDIDDGLRSNILKLPSIKKLKLWQLSETATKKQYGKIPSKNIFISRCVSKIISMMIEDLCTQTIKNIKKYRIKSPKDVSRVKGAVAEFSPKMKNMVRDMRRFLYSKFYMSPQIQKPLKQGEKMIKGVFEFYLKNSKTLPKKYHPQKNESLIIGIKDYIAGMTDLFLTDEYEKLVS
ncbi:MAG: deoxyguanosinetriphosphate triphosphohydrolase [Candidatus Gracilibacteria bacterium]|jgi:dGTPase